jgi:hypothetical protein
MSTHTPPPTKLLLGLAPEMGGTNLENTDYDLTGFTSRMVRMLAWWREAWLSADPGNAAGLCMGLAHMFIHCHSMRRNKRMCAHVLKFGHDRHEEMVEQLGNAIAVILRDIAYDGPDKLEEDVRMFWENLNR